MHSVKQALIMFRQNWKDSLLLGVLATLFTFFSQIVPVIGALLIAVGLLIFQELANLRLQKGRWQRDFTHLQKDWVSWLITAVILMPTGILMGSAFGIIHSPQPLIQSLPAGFGLMSLGVFFYFILSHGLNLQLETHQGIAKALDRTALSSVRNLGTYLIATMTVALALVIATYLRGYGLVLALPLMFFTCFYLYIELKNKKAFDKK
ncbi:hypothetical protein ACLVWU_00985 [Bdellovibrio sp. HCB290]|uniref:hypothetical protein n=1 Tax=Bdellovibrio sp. HCB290 TaxID=3394356 RepID=UPI0039B527A7